MIKTPKDRTERNHPITNYAASGNIQPITPVMNSMALSSKRENNFQNPSSTMQYPQ
jgi:hypothetical protein